MRQPEDKRVIATGTYVVKPKQNEHDGPPIARVDRYILVVTPAEPFVEWVRSLEELEGVEEGEVRYNLEEAQSLPATYLVPFSFDPNPVIAWVRDNFDTVFETELGAMARDPLLWPNNRSADQFEEWFDLKLLDAPIDLVDGPFYLSDLSEEETAERLEEFRDATGGSV